MSTVRSDSRCRRVVLAVESYVVRVWEPADDREVGRELRGVVQRVGEETATPFRTAVELLALLQPPRTAVDPSDQEGAR
jgi:hypothetical protein